MKLFPALLRAWTAALNRRPRERARAERAAETLRASEERFRLIAETITQAFWIIDVKTEAMIYISPAYEAIWGRSCDSLYRDSTSFLESIHPEDRVRVLEQRRVQHGESFGHDYRIVRPSGEIRWIWDRGFPVRNQSGQVFQYVGVAEDITDRRLLEAQLRQSLKMDAVGQLAGGIAHDFNNLLTAILGFSAILAESIAESDPRRTDVEEIRRAAERAASLTRQLLAFSRKQILAVHVLRLGDVVATLTPMLERLLREGIDLRTTFDERGLVKADPGQIEQVIVNLCVNAHDAMPDGGRLTIQTADVMLDEAFALQHPSVVPGLHVMLSVSDTGYGMDAATRARVFEPFFTTKPKGQGTGLGLATVYGIVKQSGGSIWMSSEIAKGTTFTIYLPRTDDAEAIDERPAAEASARGGSEIILLVEDEDLVRGFVERVLTAKGYTVHAMAHPARAIEFAESWQGKIDLVFTDVVLPEMSGRAMVVRLQQRRPDVRVLYMSGYDDQAIVHRGVLDPGTSFLPKPFTVDALVQKVREVLDGR
jgi:two-component system cell cycle sensor histidine kinase/response regulator CckA